MSSRILPEFRTITKEKQATVGGKVTSLLFCIISKEA